METVVIYKSKTGFTKRYAEWIAEALDCGTETYQNIDRLDLDSYDLIIYGGGIHAGRIDGLQRLRGLLQGKKCSLIVFATGATPAAATDEIDKMMDANFSGSQIPHFYMQSGLCYEKMGFADRAIMKALSKMLSGKEGKSDVEKSATSAISQSHDISDRRYIKPLVDLVRDTYGGTK